MEFSSGAASNATDTVNVEFASVAGVVAYGVIKLVLAGGLGAVTIRKLKQQVSATALVRDLSIINKEVFIPCLIFASCARGLTADLVMHLPIIPVLTFGFLIVGAGIGALVPRLLRHERSWPLCVASCAFNNVVGLPLPLLITIADGLPSLSRDAQIHSTVLSYLFLSNTCASPLLWLVAPRVLAATGADGLPILRRAESLGEGRDAGGTPGLRPSASHQQLTAELAVEASNDFDQLGMVELRGDQVERASCTRHGAGGAANCGGGAPNGGGAVNGGADSGQRAATLELAAAPDGGAGAAAGEAAGGGAQRGGAMALHSVGKLVGGLNRPSAASLGGIMVGCSPLRRLLVRSPLISARAPPERRRSFTRAPPERRLSAARSPPDLRTEPA